MYIKARQVSLLVLSIESSHAHNRLSRFPSFSNYPESKSTLHCCPRDTSDFPRRPNIPNGLRWKGCHLPLPQGFDDLLSIDSLIEKHNLSINRTSITDILKLIFIQFFICISRHQLKTYKAAYSSFITQNNHNSS